MRTIQNNALVDGRRVYLPLAFVTRAVIDVMGTVTAAIELNCREPVHGFTVREVKAGGFIPDAAYYLGTLSESYGGCIRHFYVERT